jgi:DNA-binding transcriptional LysR family regulator
MRTMSLKRLDLNLLVTFEALWRERSVTRAARRLNVAQPTVSNALAKLRDALGDQLFIRSPRGIEPTERCTEFARDVLQALRHIEQAIDASQEFNPALAKREFRIGCADYFDLLLLPDLIDRMAAQAPHIDIRLRSTQRDEGLDLLDAGELDFLMHHEGPTPKRLGMERALVERHVLAARVGHPLIDGKPDIDMFARLPHINFSQRGDSESPVDEALAELGYRRRVALTTQHMSTVANTVRSTDMLGSIPSRLAGRLVSEGSVQAFPMPFDLDDVHLTLYWNRRYELDGATSWMRETILDLCRQLPDFDPTDTENVERDPVP